MLPDVSSTQDMAGESELLLTHQCSEFQCNNGHLTCNSCHAHTRLCPLCRTNFTNVRPLAAERLAAQVPTPCR